MPLPTLSLALLLFWGKWQQNLFQIDFFSPLQTFSFLVSVCIQNWETQHWENICTKPYRMSTSSLGTPTLKAGEATLAGCWKAPDLNPHTSSFPSFTTSPIPVALNSNYIQRSPKFISVIRTLLPLPPGLGLVYPAAYPASLFEFPMGFINTYLKPNFCLSAPPWVSPVTVNGSGQAFRVILNFLLPGYPHV